jgi:hypothetical protein
VQWQLLHVEKDDQVIRPNNNKTWETKEKSIRKAFLFKTLVKNCYAEKYLFCFAGSVLFLLLFVYYFCTIFVIHQKNWLRYHPLDIPSLRLFLVLQRVRIQLQRKELNNFLYLCSYKLINFVLSQFSAQFCANAVIKKIRLLHDFRDFLLRFIC